MVGSFRLDVSLHTRGVFCEIPTFHQNDFCDALTSWKRHRRHLDAVWYHLTDQLVGWKIKTQKKVIFKVVLYKYAALTHQIVLNEFKKKKTPPSGIVYTLADTPILL